MAEPTIEDLQAQVAELKKSNEEQAQELDKLKKSSTETEENLKKARDLNAELLLRVSVPNPDTGTEEQTEDTIESICDDVVNSVNKSYMEKYKHDN